MNSPTRPIPPPLSSMETWVVLGRMTDRKHRSAFALIARVNLPISHQGSTVTAKVKAVNVYTVQHLVSVLV